MIYAVEVPPAAGAHITAETPRQAAELYLEALTPREIPEGGVLRVYADRRPVAVFEVETDGASCTLHPRGTSCAGV